MGWLDFGGDVGTDIGSTIASLWGSSGLGGGMDASLPAVDLPAPMAGPMDLPSGGGYARVPDYVVAPGGGADRGAPADTGNWFTDLSALATKAAPIISGAGGLAKLGLTGMGAYAGSQAMANAAEQTKMLKAAEERAAQAQQTAQQSAGRAEAVAAPQIAAETRLLPAGVDALLGGSLPPLLEDEVQKWMREAKSSFASLAARGGYSESTTATQMDSWVESQAQEMRAKLAQSLIQSGTSAGSAATGAISATTGAAGTAGAGQAGTLPQTQTDALSRAIQEANQAMYQLVSSTGA